MNILWYKEKQWNGTKETWAGLAEEKPRHDQGIDIVLKGED